MGTRNQNYSLEDIRIRKAQLGEQIERKRSLLKRRISGIMNPRTPVRSPFEELFSLKTAARIAGTGAVVIRGIMTGVSIARKIRSLFR